METPQQLYTVEEANALLAELTPVLETLRQQKATIEADHAELTRIRPELQHNGHGAEAARLESEIADLTRQVMKGIFTINSRGIEIKDIDQGLIDFPARREGRIIYLCWRLGEERVQFWHELDGGFAGRQPL